MGKSWRVTAGLAGLVVSASLLAIGVVGAGQEARFGDGPVVGPSAPQSEKVQPGELGTAVSVLVRSQEFRSLDPKLKGELIANAARNPRVLFIEGERRGLTFEIPLERVVVSSGPWTKVDRDALLERAGLSAGTNLPHDERDHVLTGVAFTAEDYRTTMYESEEEIALVDVAVDVVGRRVLAITPAQRPPALDESAGEEGR